MSSDKFSELEFVKRREKFLIVWKKIEPYKRRQLTKNEGKRKQYREELVNSYNAAINYIGKHFTAKA